MPLDEAPVQASSRPTTGGEDGEVEGEGKAGLWGHGRGSREPKEWMWRLWRDVSDQCSIVVHFLPCAVLLWLAGRYDFSLTATFLLCASYLAHVMTRQRQVMRGKHRMEMLQDVFRRRPMGDCETARWLNQLVRRMWPVCLERCFSDTLIPAVAPWFFQRYKPWHLKKAWLERLYLGSNPPFVTSIRMLSTNLTDDHAVMEMTMEYIASDDMLAVLGGTARKRVAMGLSAQALVSDFHMEGKMRVGVRFQRHWPYISRIRLSFLGAPFITLSVKPVGTFNITELPFVGKWVDTLLASALESFLIEPNMLVIDVKQLVHVYTTGMTRPAAAPTPQQPVTEAVEKQGRQQAEAGGNGLHGNYGVINSIRVEQAPPIAHVVIEILGASSLVKANLNGKSDPYVKGALGTSRFTTRVVASTTDPEWFEEFVAPIYSWSVANLLVLRVQDRAIFTSKSLGYLVVDLAPYRHRGRHEFWAVLSGAKTGRIHLALTVVAELAWRRRMGVPVGPESPLPIGTEPEGNGIDEGTEEMQMEDPPRHPPNRHPAGGQAPHGEAARNSASTRDPAAESTSKQASRDPNRQKGGGGPTASGVREVPRPGEGQDMQRDRIYHTPDAGVALPGGLRQLRSNSLRHPPPQGPPTQESQGRKPKPSTASAGLSESLQGKFEALQRKYKHGQLGQQPLGPAPGSATLAHGTATAAGAGPPVLEPGSSLGSRKENGRAGLAARPEGGIQVGAQHGPSSGEEQLSPLSFLRKQRLSRVKEAEASGRLSELAGPEPSLGAWEPGQTPFVAGSHASPEDEGRGTGWNGEFLSTDFRSTNSASISANSFAGTETGLTRTHSWHSDSGNAGLPLPTSHSPEPFVTAPLSPTHSECCLGLTNFLDFEADGASAPPHEVHPEVPGEARGRTGSAPTEDTPGARRLGSESSGPGDLRQFSDSTRRWLEDRQASLEAIREPRGSAPEGVGAGGSSAVYQAEGSSIGGSRPSAGPRLQRLNQISAETVHRLEERAADEEMDRMQDEDGYQDLGPREEAWLRRALAAQDESEVVQIPGFGDHDVVHVLRPGIERGEAVWVGTRQGGRKAEAAAKQGYMDGDEKGPRFHALLDALKEGKNEIMEGAGNFFGSKISSKMHHNITVARRRQNAAKDWGDEDVLGEHAQLRTQALEELDQWDEMGEGGEPSSHFWGRTPSEQVASRPSRGNTRLFTKHFNQG